MREREDIHNISINLDKKKQHRDKPLQETRIKQYVEKVFYKNPYKIQESGNMSRKYFAKTFTRDKNHKNIEKRNDKPLKETRISKNVEK